MSDDPDGGPMGSRLYLGEASEEFWAARDRPQWRPGAMRPEERDRLVRIGLGIVMGERAAAFFVRRAPDDSIEIGDEQHSFGCPADVVLGTDPQTVMAHDIEWLVDELCETEAAWAEQLPVCPIHPGSHPLHIVVNAGRVTASCPIAGEEVRSASF